MEQIHHVQPSPVAIDGVFRIYNECNKAYFQMITLAPKLEYAL